MIPNVVEFFELINHIETGESHTSRNWNHLLRDARFAERCKAYEKMFYRFLDGKLVC